MVSFSNYLFLHHHFEKNKRRWASQEWPKTHGGNLCLLNLKQAILLMLFYCCCCCCGGCFRSFVRSSRSLDLRNEWILLLDCVCWCDALTCFINIHMPTVSSRYVCTYTISTLFDLLRWFDLMWFRLVFFSSSIAGMNKKGRKMYRMKWQHGQYGPQLEKIWMKSKRTFNDRWKKKRNKSNSKAHA